MVEVFRAVFSDDVKKDLVYDVAAVGLESAPRTVDGHAHKEVSDSLGGWSFGRDARVRDVWEEGLEYFAC